ncbi:hypothetical protein [Paludisphaera rhizosphaerae]|uniref:hypothetical protein n=1 Tax=Paludisphaera rhizosphaerae TaxID=2711216 RepID=UPI0013ECE7E9|nr:hypothetical protein [Paludisphaera rhizosphaerae]
MAEFNPDELSSDERDVLSLICYFTQVLSSRTVEGVIDKVVAAAKVRYGLSQDRVQDAINTLFMFRVIESNGQNPVYESIPHSALPKSTPSGIEVAILKMLHPLGRGPFDWKQIMSAIKTRHGLFVDGLEADILETMRAFDLIALNAYGQPLLQAAGKHIAEEALAAGQIE